MSAEHAHSSGRESLGKKMRKAGARSNRDQPGCWSFSESKHGEHYCGHVVVQTGAWYQRAVRLALHSNVETHTSERTVGAALRWPPLCGINRRGGHGGPPLQF